MNDGFYRVDVTMLGFKPVSMEHLQLKASEVTHASVTLRLDSALMITVGIVAGDPMTRNEGLSTTFSKDFIDKLP
ncbi:MAG TPA: hypothetical protein VGQ76_27515 [Thermoanaerobaculia bacterium]|nr:hypothetical protein [Thermoanaerobaculia bacterium]